jgi:hypothetical protein
MTFHTYRSTGPAKGSRMLNKHGKSFSPRVTVSFSEKDFAKLTSIAANKYGMPVSAPWSGFSSAFPTGIRNLRIR